MLSDCQIDGDLEASINKDEDEEYSVSVFLTKDTDKNVIAEMLKEEIVTLTPFETLM